MKQHEPVLMIAADLALDPGPLSALLGKWIECECGWISDSGQYSERQLLEKHGFHVFLVTTYPRGKGLKVTRNGSNTGWILADRETGVHVSPKPPHFWGNRRRAMQALLVLQKGDR